MVGGITTRAAWAWTTPVVIALLVPTGLVLAEDEAPQEDLLGKASLRRLSASVEPPRRLFELPRRATVAGAVSVATVTIEGTQLVLYDMDGNGTFTDAGIDAWRVDEADFGYALPIESTIVLDGARTRLSPGADAKTLCYEHSDSAWPELPSLTGKTARADVRQARQDVLRALAIWNGLRMRNGLTPVYLDSELTAACMLHARYMERWGVTHEPDPEREGFTPEGHRVARSGSVGSLAAAEEIVEVYSTFYHRISLFHPATRGAGIGSAGSRSIFNGTEGREKRPWTWPVIIPAPETDDVPRVYHRELPIPHERLFDDGTIGEAGFPITLTFPRDAVTDVAADLRAGGADGKPVPFALSWPQQPASPDAANNYKSICLLPHEPLRARTTYWVHVEWTYRGELDQATWTFATGR